jgi:hypothetical protein
MCITTRGHDLISELNKPRKQATQQARRNSFIELLPFCAARLTRKMRGASFFGELK